MTNKTNKASKYVFIEVIEDQAYLIDFRIISNIEEYKDVIKYIEPKYVFVTNRTDNDLANDIFDNIDIFECYDKEDKEDQKVTNDLQLYLVPQIEELSAFSETKGWEWSNKYYDKAFEKIMMELLSKTDTVVIEKQMNTIHIWLCEAPTNVLIQPYQTVYTHVNSNIAGDIDTYDTSWFSQSSIRKGYNVIVYNGYGNIDLSILLANKLCYTDREIRPSHNVYKMLMAGAFKFK